MSASNTPKGRYEGAWWRREYPEKDWAIFEDFRVFLWLVWIHLGLPKPTPIQYDIAYYLQHGPKRSMIEAFRGVGKSWITSAFVCWLLLRDPQLKIMVVSASKDRADMFSAFVKRLIAEMPILQHLQAEPGQRDSMISFDVGPAKPDHSPSVKSVGIFGQLTGSRADIIIPDDVEVPNNSETQGMRDKLSERVKEFDAVLKPLKSSRICYLGTPQCEDSLYNQLAERGYELRIWPARYPSPAWMVTQGHRLAPTLLKALEENPGINEMAEYGGKGAPTDPDRFDHMDLEEREFSYGRSGFALQFMLDTSLSDMDKYPLKLSDMMVLEVAGDMAPEKLVWAGDPQYVIKDIDVVGLKGDRYYRPAYIHDQFAPFTGSVMFIDPSGRGKDETAYAVVKMLNGFLYLTEQGGMADGYSDETLTALAEAAKRGGCNKILVEKNFGDGMFSSLLKPHLRRIYPCTVEEVNSTGMKEARIIDTLEPVLNQHRLVIDRRVIERDAESTKHLPPEKAQRYQLLYQLTRMVKERGALAHDDRVESLAGAVRYWVDQMAQDADDKMEDRKQQLIELEIEAFHGNMGISIDLLAMGADLETLKKRKTSDPKTTWMNTNHHHH